MLLVRNAHDASLARLIAAHGGPVARWQASEAGIPASMLRRRLRAGHARAWFGDVLLFGWPDGEPPSAVRSAGAWLAGGPGAALGGEEGARRLGVWNRPSGRIDVWTRMHRTPLPERDIRLRRLVDDPPAFAPEPAAPTVLAPIRIVRQLGSELDAYQVAYVLDRLRAMGQLDFPGFTAEVDAWYGRPGAAVLRAARDLHLGGSMGTCNRTEDRVRRMIEGRLPTPLVNVRNATGIAGAVPDFVWRDRGKVLEIDGGWVHGSPGMGAADAQRDADHRARGWETSRVDARRVWHEPAAVLAEIVAFVER